MEGEKQVGKTEREYGRGQGLEVVESDGSVIVESDSEVEVDVEVEGDREVIEGDREMEPQPGTSGLGCMGEEMGMGRKEQPGTWA